MKKYVQSFWVRALAVLLCTVTLITGVAAGAFFAAVSLIDKEEVYENGKAAIVENYAAFIYEYIREGEHQDVVKVNSFLLDKNFTCMVSKIEGGDIGEEASEKEEVQIYSNTGGESEWDYTIEILDGAYIKYETESLMDALRGRPIIENYTYTVEAAITGFAFDATTGLFYYKADNQYFLVDYILIADEGAYYDYRITNTDGGKKIYYNSYYDLTLDTTLYQQWEWVQLGEKRLTFSMGDSPTANEIAVITDDSLRAKLYTGVYYERYEYDMISYYPERTNDIYIIHMDVSDLSYAGKYYTDMFYEWSVLCNDIYANQFTYQFVMISCIILFVLSFALLIYSAKKEKEQLGIWNKTPVVCFTLITGIFELAMLELFVWVWEYSWYGYNRLPFELASMILIMIILTMVVVLFIWLQNIITRFKTRSFIRYSELYYASKVLKWTWLKITIPFKTVWRIARENTSLFMKGVVTMFVISFLEFLAYVICNWHVEVYLLFFVVIKAAELFVVVCALLQMKKLQEGSKRIAMGDLSEPIDTSKMFWEFKKHGENINKAGDGIALAVEDRMKSERFKTELITNVSHDIKTPLTSIINYVDLIKKEDIKDETLKEYVEVLDRQSARLKKLIEDLMEASKASTGNMSVNMEACDVEVLLTQLLGEFEERLSANELEVVVQKPEHPMIILADGRHMWRVLDNLLNNACKYSLPGSRVYVSLEENQGEAILTFKNISKAALNIPSDELMERFVRGDSSRNTEGSGLGLSIAQSLTELMQGNMKLEIDGDLFKVILKFSISK